MIIQWIDLIYYENNKFMKRQQIICTISVVTVPNTEISHNLIVWKFSANGQFPLTLINVFDIPEMYYTFQS